MLWLFERLPAALALLFGLVVGSFLNVCIYRIPLGISVAKGRLLLPRLRGEDRMVRQRPPAELSCAARPLPALRGPDFSAVSRRGGRQRPAVAPLLPEPRVLRQ